MNSTILPATELRYIKGVGPKRALIFQKLGIHTVRDLLYLFPRRYEDRSHFVSLGNLKLSEPVTVHGEILEVKFKPIRKTPLVEILIGDSSGTLKAVWFNQPYLKKQFTAGQQVVLYGKADLYQKSIQMSNPEFEVIESLEESSVHFGRITPIYPLTEGLFQRSLRTTLKEAIDHHLNSSITDFLPGSFREDLNLVPLDTALQQMHFPISFEHQEKARRRIVFDEFFAFELQLFLKVKAMKSRYQAYPIRSTPELLEEFRKSLPFELTSGQTQALKEISCDMAQTVPMNRLLQGDVGSGKTVIAAFAFFLAARSNVQSAFLIPTEILAEQHYRTLTKILAPLGLRTALLTKSTETEQKERLLAELKQGRIFLAVGTHALLQETVQFQNLGMVVIDEQHKFGVHQRNQLLARALRPHQLVMTATPIPRTLALTLYADMDLSLMKELPKGRKPIKTFWITRKKQDEVFCHMAARIRKGEQAYIVFPIIDETEKADLLAAKKEYERLRKNVFPDFRLGLVHGKLTREEREATMRAFMRGEIQILVATSVIEVGVDQPNATLMVVENAERFGLAQLHQLRGRIGRGELDSECFLFGEPNTEEGKKRLRLMTKLHDGFQIADEDMKLRGPGDLWGTRQSGEPLFRIAHPVLDEEVLLLAKAEAQKVTLQAGLKELESENHWVQKYLEQFPKTY